MSTLDVGAQAPEFTLPCSDGQDVSSTSLRGRPLVLFFYPRDNTPGCTQEACDFRTLNAEFAAAGAAVYGVSTDSIKSHAGFIRKYDLNFPLLTDADHAVHEAYGVWGEKKLYGKVSMGCVRSSFLIDGQGVIRQIWRKVKVNGHAAEVLEALRKL